MDNNFAEFLTTGGWNTPTHILERRLILSVVKVLCTRYTHSLHPHCTQRVENAKGKGCTCTRCTRGSGIPETNHLQSKFTIIGPNNYKTSLLCGLISQTSAEKPPKNGGVRKANSSSL
jgi:hypothetical protein